MASPHEPQLEQSPGPLALPTELQAPPSFPSVLGSPTFDASAPSGSHPAQLDPLFPKDPESDSLADMHIPHQPPPMTVAPMETTATPTSAPPTAFQASFMSPDQHQHSPPLDLSSSGFSSHTSSPSAPSGANNPAFAGMSTSLAHAFNAIMASSAPPTSFQNTPSDLAFPSAGGNNLSPQHPSGFHFPPLDLDNRPPARADPTPDVPGGPHVLVLEDILKKCVHLIPL